MSLFSGGSGPFKALNGPEICDFSFFYYLASNKKLKRKDMRLFKWTLLILFFMNGILSYSQNTEGYHGRPESVIYKHGRIVLPNGMKLSPEAINMMFDEPDGYQLYQKTTRWHTATTVISLSSATAFIAFAYISNASLKTERPISQAFRDTFVITDIVLFFSGALADGLLKRKMKRWGNSYNTMGIIQTHAEMSVGPTPSGFGLCLNF